MPASGIAEKFEVSKRYVCRLVNFKRRGSIPAQFRRVVGEHRGNVVPIVAG